jgi:phosphatidylglycerophosphatase A
MARDDRWPKVVASAFGLGYLPVAPGTWSSAAAALVWVGIPRLPAPWWAVLQVGLLVVTVAVGLAVCPRAEAAFGRKDPSQFVLDEVAGQWLACLAFRWRGPAATALVAFLAFRLFDVAKPFPIRRLEKLHAGWGVMLDDLLAGVYAAAAAWLVCYGILDRLLA